MTLILIILASWYLSYVITSTHGPAHIFETLRERYPLGGLTGCIYCLLPYVGLFVLVVYAFAPTLVLWLAIAGGAGVLHRLGDDY